MHRKQFAKSTKTFFCAGLLLVSLQSPAQPDCRSIIGAHLKPLATTPVSWAVEGMGAGGILTDRTIAHWNIYGALDFTSGKHQAYFEGSYKDWYNSAKNPDGVEPQTGLPDYNRPAQKHWGLRELFYRFGTRESYVKAGIQSLKLPDFLLFDERMIGISAVQKWGLISVSAYSGTVSQQIARFQDVCGTRHVYNLFHRSQFNFVGKQPGETNFASLFLTWIPDQFVEENQNQVDSAENKDEFEVFAEDEFSSENFITPENSQIQKRNTVKLEKSGLFFYEEFGSGFHEYKYYTGMFAGISFPENFTFKAELIDQYILNDHALAWWASLEKLLYWGNGQSSGITLGYLGKFDISQGAHFYPAFSNLFLGEVMKLDAIDLPLLSGTVKHYCNGKWKPTIQFNGVYQPEGNQSRELDVLLGFKPFRNSRITLIGSYLNSELMEKDYWMTKLEFRIAF